MPAHAAQSAPSTGQVQLLAVFSLPHGFRLGNNLEALPQPPLARARQHMTAFPSYGIDAAISTARPRAVGLGGGAAPGSLEMQSGPQLSSHMHMIFYPSLFQSSSNPIEAASSLHRGLYHRRCRVPLQKRSESGGARTSELHIEGGVSHRLLPALPVASAARRVAHELLPLQHCSSTCRTREMMLQLLVLDNRALKHSGS